jgi:hypothetical protein
VTGEFVDIAGERFYAIRNVDKMAPFFISVVSNVDHWLFALSTGGLTAGRVSPETALLPYNTVDKILESAEHVGTKTIVRVDADGGKQVWEPFNREQDWRYAVDRNIFKSVLGNKLCFEEINHDLGLAFRYSWATSEDFGFVRSCELENLGGHTASVDLLDGLQNVLPAGLPRYTQANSSNLADAYKWTELDEDTGLAFFALYSAISDRAEPCESLKANTAFCVGLEERKTLISSVQLGDFRNGETMQQESHKRGIRGAYLVSATIELAPRGAQKWQIVADVEQSQSQVVALRTRLQNPAEIAQAIAQSVDRGSDELARIMASADGFQAAAEESVSVHHYANVLFNTLRGGIFDDQYNLSARDFARTVEHFNREVYRCNRALLDGLPDTINSEKLLAVVAERGDPQLMRLCCEYLPITFGRRHGDPSRPWNQFAIRLKDEYGNRLLSYEGNWRDIFQNWEALTFSYPGFAEGVIAKFVNASTVDGYNPYRITKEGIDWEVEEPDDPWSYIGYWGDHQIIYLEKLLELSARFHPTRLSKLLREPIFSYANVPYRIKPFEDLLENPKSTVEYDAALAETIAQRVALMGADGKLVLDPDGRVYLVNLLEKLLVPLLCKLGNFVIDGGIWLNTQRPEWNDANNALVGHGLSMVTLSYMRRYARFLQDLLADESETVEVSAAVANWLTETNAALAAVRPALGSGPITASQRFESMSQLSLAASHYREVAYGPGSFSDKVELQVAQVEALLHDALAAIDHSIGTNRRDDSLYHAYNLLRLDQQEVSVDTLYPMLEGQVAVLSAGALAPKDAVAVLEALFASSMYRPDQHSFMLYPDRQLPKFLAKNRIPSEFADKIPLVQRMLSSGDTRIVERDADGCCRFSADFGNASDLDARLNELKSTYGAELDSARKPLLQLYETVFAHKAFTGRSGTMFGFEGLGCIYWHMVSKLLLAAQENFFRALDHDADQMVVKQLGSLYYRVREGIGFNKTPLEYGAFPTDPYSHTPKHAGARQPGMTGQVKEEVLTRFGELGVRVSDGSVRFQPALLRAREFIAEPRPFRFLDVDANWQYIDVPAGGLAFTWCQLPVVYKLADDDDPSLRITLNDGKEQTLGQLTVPEEMSSELFRRSGRIRQITVTIAANHLFGE